MLTSRKKQEMNPHHHRISEVTTSRQSSFGEERIRRQIVWLVYTLSWLRSFFEQRRRSTTERLSALPNPVQQDSDNGFPSQENFRRCQSLFRCTNEMMNSARNSRKHILASHATAPASTVKPSAAATIAISKKINA
jgi:hypothetical protein